MTCTLVHEKIATYCALPLVLLVLTTGVARSAAAQTDSAPEVAREPGATSAPTATDLRFTVETNSRFGVFTYVPERWGDLQLRLENGGSESRDVLCTSYFNDQATLQFGRRVWVPPHARLGITHPILFPAADQFKDSSALIHSLVIENVGGKEVLVKSEGGQLRQQRPLLVSPTDRNTGVIAGWTTTDAVPQDVLDHIAASRVNQSLTDKITVVSGHFLPVEESCLKYLDHLVIVENRLADDYAALAAVRRWLHAGGRLWVMLDRVDPVLLERLLGDEFQGEVVDRVGLTAVRIDKPPSLTSPDGETGETVEFDQPVAMTRMVVSGVKVWNTVDGWPAAMSRTCGEGRVLMTTLGPRAWLKLPTTGTGAVGTKLVVNSPMEDLAAFVLAKRDPEPLPKTTLEPLVEEYVAYSVPTWTLIVGTLGVFLMLMMAAGWWFWRIDRLEHFGWSGSLLAVLFGIFLTGIGMANRYSVPDAIAGVQLAQAVSGTDDVRTYGTIAVYRSEASDARIETLQGGELWPDLTGSDGSTRRMVTTDLGAFHWDGLTQPAGLRVYADATARSYPVRIAARATLNAQGLVGTYSGQSASTTDALLATRNGRIAVNLNGENGFSAAAKDVLDVDQYLQATFLGDVQDRRRRLLQQLFASPSWKASLEQPHLLLWLDDWDHGFRFGEGLERQGETLLTIPLDLTRPPTGTEVVIPSPLLVFKTRRPPDGSLPTGFWDDARHEWHERTGPSTTWLSLQLPRVLLPLKASQARVSVKVSGPMGQIEILGVKEGNVVSLAKVADPAGTLEFDIDDPDVLAVTEEGDLTLGISCGVTSEGASSSAPGGATASYWRIDEMAVELRGVTSDLAEAN